ncbi:hypothetical protein LNQ03_08280 [Klebsiella pneumoniae subsp. pneumoniae]|nr:hypothetical protein [Klebsiella pneumoniae subsp. pneumoniae]
MAPDGFVTGRARRRMPRAGCRGGGGCPRQAFRPGRRLRLPPVRAIVEKVCHALCWEASKGGADGGYRRQRPERPRWEGVAGEVTAMISQGGDLREKAYHVRTGELLQLTCRTDSAPLCVAATRRSVAGVCGYAFSGQSAERAHHSPALRWQAIP